MSKNDNYPYVFRFIAPVYGLFYKYQKVSYRKEIEIITKKKILKTDYSILDVGCGTGALSAVLSEYGYSVTGVDPVEGMIRIARKKAKDQDVEYVLGNVLNGLEMDDKIFDVTIASYVAHGMKKPERLKMYSEMKRVTKDKVLLFEYNQNKNFFISFIEFLEGGDYFNFVKEVKRELNQEFRNVEIIRRNNHGSLYICSI